MQTRDTRVCVGGQLDGMRAMAPEDKHEIILTVPPPLRTPATVGIRARVEYGQACYLRDRINVGSVSLSFWRSTEVTPEQAIQMIFERYPPRDDRTGP